MGWQAVVAELVDKGGVRGAGMWLSQPGVGVPSSVAMQTVCERAHAWTCMHVPDDELCDKMTARWWELRKAVQEAHKLAEGPQCLGETYTPLAIPDL